MWDYIYECMDCSWQIILTVLQNTIAPQDSITEHKGNFLSKPYLHGWKLKVSKILNFWNSNFKNLQDGYKNGQFKDKMIICV